jgi:hypothetical protein
MFNDVLCFANPEEAVAFTYIGRIVKLRPLINTFYSTVQGKILRLNHVGKCNRESNYSWLILRKVMANFLIVRICQV